MASGLDCAAEDLGFARSSQGENKVWVQKSAAEFVDFEAHQRRRVPCPLPAVIFGQRVIDKQGRIVILPGLGGDASRKHPQASSPQPRCTDGAEGQWLERHK